MSFPLILRILLLVSWSASSTAFDTTLPKPFNASYNANYSGLKVTANSSLKAVEDGLLEFRFEAKSFLASIEEYSQFNWSHDGHLTPKTYVYSRNVLGKSRDAVLRFNWLKNKVENDVQGKAWKMKIPDQTLDKLGYQLQLRHDLINQRPLKGYKVADGGRLKTYEFEIQGTEVLETPLGKLNTTIVKRIREDEERSTSIWFASDWDYLIVKLQQTEDDGKSYEINISTAILGEIPVTGL